MTEERVFTGLVIFAFLVGSLPFGLWVARFYKVADIRTSGSGNIGATNVSRVAGFWPAGALTFLLDLFKGALPPALLLPTLYPVWTSWIPGLRGEFEPTAALSWMLGLLAVLGHCFTPWLRFKGGKGVATGFGVLIVLSPWAAGAGAAAFAATFWVKRLGSLASLIGLGIATATHVILHPLGAHLWPAIVLVLVILYRHTGNLESLVEDRERAF